MISKYILPIVLIGLYASACAEAPSKAEDVGDYRSQYLVKCESEGETSDVCACAFDGWAANLADTQAPGALAAARLLVLDPDVTPSSKDLTKGVRELQNVSIALAGCSDQAEQDTTTAQDSYALTDAIETAVRQPSGDVHGSTFTMAQTSAVMNDILQRAIAGEVGNGDATTEERMRESLEQLGRGDLVDVLGAEDGSWDLQDLERLDAQQSAASQALDNSRTAQPDSGIVQAQNRRDMLNAQFAMRDPRDISVSQFKAVNLTNCRADGGSETYCDCRWRTLQDVLANQDDAATRTASFMVSLPPGDMVGVDAKTREAALVYLQRHIAATRTACGG